MAAFSALMACILLLVFTLSLFVTFFSDRGALRYACSDHFLSSNTSCSGHVRVFGAEVPDPVFPSLVAAIGLLALVGVAMIGYLATFHMYLSKNHIYIRIIIKYTCTCTYNVHVYTCTCTCMRVVTIVQLACKRLNTTLKRTVYVYVHVHARCTVCIYIHV